MAQGKWEKLASVYNCSPLIPKFEDIYMACGGNIFLMKEALVHWFEQHGIERQWTGSEKSQVNEGVLLV